MFVGFGKEGGLEESSMREIKRQRERREVFDTFASPIYSPSKPTNFV
jgi:hypothetical protein